MNRLRCKLVWLLLIATCTSFAGVRSSAAQSDDAGDARRVGVGNAGFRGLVSTGLPVQPHELNVSATGGYGYTESIAPVEGAHHRGIGTLGVALAPLPWLAVALRFDGRLDMHPDDGHGAHGAAVGDPQLLARVGTWVNRELALGAELGLWFPGNDAPSYTPAATTGSLRGLLAYAPHESPLTLLMAAGFRLDQSAASAPDLTRMRFGDRLALGLSDSHAVLAALGVAYRVHHGLELFAELSADLLIGSQAPSLGQSPLRAVLGGRYDLSEALALELSTIGSLSSRPAISATASLVPIEPRVSVLLGLRWSLVLDESKQALVPPAEPRPAVTPTAVTPTAAPAAPAAPQRTRVSGVLTDHEGAPLPEAIVRLQDSAGEQRETITDAAGGYGFDDVPLGPAVFEASATGFDTQRWELEVAVVAVPEAARALAPTTTSGMLRGLVRSYTSEPLRATVIVRDPRGRIAKTVVSDVQGQFELELVPGRYRVTIEAPAYRSHSRTVQILANNVTILNVDLREERRAR